MWLILDVIGNGYWICGFAHMNKIRFIMCGRYPVIWQLSESHVEMYRLH